MPYLCCSVLYLHISYFLFFVPMELYLLKGLFMYLNQKISA